VGRKAGRSLISFDRCSLREIKKHEIKEERSAFSPEAKFKLRMKGPPDLVQTGSAASFTLKERRAIRVDGRDTFNGKMKKKGRITTNLKGQPQRREPYCHFEVLLSVREVVGIEGRLWMKTLKRLRNFAFKKESTPRQIHSQKGLLGGGSDILGSFQQKMRNAAGRREAITIRIFERS